MATFETGGARFSLHAIPAEIAKSIVIESPPVPREQHALKLSFEVKDVESERARLESPGVQLLRRPRQKPEESCDAVDPEGNVRQICSRGADWPYPISMTGNPVTTRDGKKIDGIVEQNTLRPGSLGR